MKEQNPRRQIVIRKREICDRCGTVMPFLQQEGMRDVGVFHRAHARCKNCGAVVQIRSYPPTGRDDQE